MKRLLATGMSLALTALLVACASAPEYPPPGESEFQLVVKVTASRKTGAQDPRTEGQYEKESVEQGRRFTRVDYKDMREVAVYLEGAPAGGPAPMEAEWAIDANGVNHDLLLLGPGKNMLRVRNLGSKPLTLYGSAPDSVLFDETTPAGGEFVLRDIRPGHYEICCDEDRFVRCELVVAPSSYAALVESGGEAFFSMFAGNTPIDVVVVAPRLPPWRKGVVAPAGKRETLYAELTVNSLPKK